jgi:hypothetical protein
VHAKRAKKAGTTEQEPAEATHLSVLGASGAMTHGTHKLE